MWELGAGVRGAAGLPVTCSADVYVAIRAQRQRPVLDWVLGRYEIIDGSMGRGVSSRTVYKRLTTFRGDRPSFRACLDFPSVLVHRLAAPSWLPFPQPARPMLVAGAVKRLDSLLTPCSTVLEIGAGNSTVWLCERSFHVVSLETAPEWAAYVRRKLRSRHLTDKVDLRVVTGAAAKMVVDRLPDSSIDVCLLDSSMDAVPRHDMVGHLPRVMRDNGCVVLDDTDSPLLDSAVSYLANWRRETHVGYCYNGLVVSETSLFFKERA
jgi:hypothetical protein